MVNLRLNYSLEKIIVSSVYMNNWKQRSENSTFAFWKHKHTRDIFSVLERLLDITF